MITDEIRFQLFELQDLKYRDFNSSLIPTIDKSTVIGVRTPALRKLAKELVKRNDIGEFLTDLPHRYFDENQLHAFIISGIKDYDACMAEVKRFLPYIDNWATSDQLSPKVFKKHHAELLEEIRGWIDAGGNQVPAEMTYTVRFATGMLMQHFLDEDFKLEYAEIVSGIRSEEYYVNMMTAWYFATALAKQYDAVIPFIENRRLDRWTHNKAIQKSVESYRITPEQKTYLRSLRWK